MKLRVMSWNLWHGEFLDEIVAFLRHSDADIIALQEVADTPGGPQMAAHIAEATGYHAAHYHAFTTDRHDPPFQQGNTILSRHAIQQAGAHVLSDLSRYQGTAETEPRIAVKACINVNGVGLTVLNTHLAHTTDFASCQTRLDQVDSLTGLVEPRRTVLMGDFNVEPGSEELRRIGTVMANADPEPEHPTAFLYEKDRATGEITQTEPQYRIDHIFVTPDVEVESFEVLDVRASDHYPVTALIHV